MENSVREQLLELLDKLNESAKDIDRKSYAMGMSSAAPFGSVAGEAYGAAKQDWEDARALHSRLYIELWERLGGASS